MQEASQKLSAASTISTAAASLVVDDQCLRPQGEPATTDVREFGRPESGQTFGMWMEVESRFKLEGRYKRVDPGKAPVCKVNKSVRKKGAEAARDRSGLCSD
jgi:hypothetical protein